MTGYFSCHQCAHQWTNTGSMFDSVCPKCGGDEAEIEIGANKPPPWWKPTDNDAAMKDHGNG